MQRAGEKDSVTLFKNLFGHRDRQYAIRMISSGVCVIIDHASDLLAESRHLFEREYLARGELLLAVAAEELGKCHLLIDAARLDPERHQGELRHPCKGFYNHLTKYAYMRLWRFSPRRPRSFGEVGKAFDSEREPVSPGSPDPEDAEPDMPCPSYFSRDASLYVDFSDYARDWIKPRSRMPHAPGALDLFSDFLCAADEHLRAWIQLRNGHALGIAAVTALNGVWGSAKTLSRSTALEMIEAPQRRTAQAVSAKCLLSSAAVLASPLCFWPCYAFRPEKAKKNGNRPGSKRAAVGRET
jgi:AbiV family abortive infection protein